MQTWGIVLDNPPIIFNNKLLKLKHSYKGGFVMKKFGIKEVVATGIGTALFVVLTEVQIPLGIPHYIRERHCSHSWRLCSDRL